MITVKKVSEIMTKSVFKHRINNEGEIEVWFRVNDRLEKETPWIAMQFCSEREVYDLIDSPSGY